MNAQPGHLDHKELISIEELAISNMWKTAALVEVLDRRSILTRQELYDAINELRQRQRAHNRGLLQTTGLRMG